MKNLLAIAAVLSSVVLSALRWLSRILNHIWKSEYLSALNWACTPEGREV